MWGKKRAKPVYHDKFRDKVTVITGASKGIGRQLVIRLINEGAKVAGLARSESLLDTIASEVDFPERFLAVVCDVTDPQAVEHAMYCVRDHFGFIDILINNAGLGLAGPLVETEADAIASCFDVNFFSAIRCIEQVAPEMIKRKKGILVNVTSSAANFGIPTYGIYSAAKSALANYSQALRNELAPAGIHVLTVFPGNTDTSFHNDLLRTKNFTPRLNRRQQMSPDFVVNKILSSIKKGKSEVVIGRSAKVLNVLKTLAPSLLEWLLRKELKVEELYRDNASEEIPKPSNFIDESLKSGVSLLGINRPCQYHESVEQANKMSAIPKGLSPSLYYFLYPYLLAMTYGGKFPLNSAYSNPVAEEGEPVTIQWNAPPIFEKIKNLVKTILSPFVPLGRIKMAPEINTSQGVFPFDLGKDGSLCPASFRSFFPYQVHHHLKDKQNGTQTPWKVCCPDHLKHHTFGEKQGLPSEEDSFYESICNWGSHVQIKNKGSCNIGLNNNTQTLDSILAPLGFPCASLLNVMYGYYLTLAKDGELAFYSKSFDAGIAQCPCPKSRVVVEITRKQETIEFKTIDVIGEECPKGIKKGGVVTLPKKADENHFCLDAFNSIFLSAGLAEFSNEPLKTRCVSQSCPASWEISYEGPELSSSSADQEISRNQS